MSHGIRYQRQAFPHFSERLKQRYRLLITFEDYQALCVQHLRNVRIEYEPDGELRGVVGWITHRGTNIYVAKAPQARCGTLITALPFLNNKPKRS